MSRSERPGKRPAYLDLLRSGELARRVTRAYRILEKCVLCGRQCEANRTEDPPKGASCFTGVRARIDGYGAHHGEEAALRGWAGSGTIFFSWCNLRCQYCQNSEISQDGRGREYEPDDIAGMMLDLQDQGCHNINLVTPSHVIAQILASVKIAAERGLQLPIVYNSGGYDDPTGLALLDGVVDIYMPDMKYGDSATARIYSNVRNYHSINKRAIKEMHRQVGDLVLDGRGLARRGLLVRHLVLPEGLANTGKILKFLAEEISPNTYVHLMDQYRPAYRASEFPPLARPLTDTEYGRAVKLARKYGINRLDGHAPGA